MCILPESKVVMSSTIKSSVIVALLAFSCVTQSIPVSFPDSQPSLPVEAAASAGNLYTTLAPSQNESGDVEDPIVSQIVDRVPQILDRIQNYINSAINSYSKNDTTTNQPPAQLNQFLGLVDGFLSATNNFAQQFLQPATNEETTAEPGGTEKPESENNEVV